jgi:ABC-2 type transport system ATP-binding protein
MSGLDPIGRREIRELISELRENGTTVFMSTHILSDIEALCDNVAILRKGRLAATGKLDELLTSHGETQAFEVVIKGISAEELEKLCSGINISNIDAKPNGANLQVTDEAEIEKILRKMKPAGGKLVSILPVKQSLEELFVEKTEKN